MTAADGVALRQTLARRPPWLGRTLNRLTAPHSVPDPVARLHAWLYERSDGRVGHLILGIPTLLLRTTGRRTGNPRRSSLSYVLDGERVVIAASNAGADRPPAWFCNLRSNPSVQIQVGRHHLSGSAAVLDSGNPDYGRLWASMNAISHGRYDGYQTQTSRPIALVAISIKES